MVTFAAGETVYALNPKYRDGTRLRARADERSNFVCVEVPGGKTAELCRRLEEKAIYVRDIGGRFPGYVRVTVGLSMGRVVDALAEAIGAAAP